MSKNNPGTVRVSAEALTMMPVDALVPYANNAKRHSAAQISQIRASLREYGFVAPVLIDEDCNILAGHGRVAAARAEGMEAVPCVLVTDLTEVQRKAYILADNRLAEAAAWDEELLKIELESLAAADFDTCLTGFDISAEGSVYVNGHTRAAPGQAAHADSPDDPGSADDSEYQAFVDKFKPKKTTDDCYTPEPVYEAVRAWAVRRYSLGDAPIVRPFFPGGDYESADYPDGCVVIDNPPFSILSQICRTYIERGIRFFLFAPTLTLFSSAAGAANYLPACCSITYENGARVNTSFVTNMGQYKIEMAPDLFDAVSAADADVRAERAVSLARYCYPPNVLSVGDFDIVKHGQALRIPASAVSFVRALDAQRDRGKAIFGGGFLLSEKAAAEKAAAEKAAAEKAAAEKWELSPRELEIVSSLD